MTQARDRHRPAIACLPGGIKTDERLGDVRSAGSVRGVIARRAFVLGKQLPSDIAS
jgi:hypothetical protein